MEKEIVVDRFAMLKRETARIFISAILMGTAAGLMLVAEIIICPKHFAMYVFSWTMSIIILLVGVGMSLPVTQGAILE